MSDKNSSEQKTNYNSLFHVKEIKKNGNYCLRTF